MVAVAKEFVSETDLLERLNHYWIRFYDVRISAGRKVRKKIVPFKDEKVLIKAWGRRPEKKGE